MIVLPAFRRARLAVLHLATGLTATLVAGIVSTAMAQAPWIKYADPAERAFTMDVPAGYRVEGGTVRVSQIDPRAIIRATSPDGTVIIQFGDRTIPNFGEPSQITIMQGLREGASYQLSGGQRLTVSRYIPGVEFAYQYGQRVMQSICSKPELKAARPVPNPARFSYWANAGTTVLSGEAYFLCPDQGKVGWVFASTAETRMQQSAVWTVPGIVCFVAPKAQAGAVLAKTLHMSYSIVVDENWRAQLLRAQGAYGEDSYRNFKAELSADAEQMHRTDQRLKSTFQGMDDIISGVTPTVDPLTGERHDILNGTGNYYWADGMGRTTTTKTYIPPGPDVHPLQVLRPDQR